LLATEMVGILVREKVFQNTEIGLICNYLIDYYSH